MWGTCDDKDLTWAASNGFAQETGVGEGQMWDPQHDASHYRPSQLPHVTVHTTSHAHTPARGVPMMEGKLRPKRKRDWLRVPVEGMMSWDSGLFPSRCSPFGVSAPALPLPPAERQPSPGHVGPCLLQGPLLEFSDPGTLHPWGALASALVRKQLRRCQPGHPVLLIECWVSGGMFGGLIAA